MKCKDNICNTKFSNDKEVFITRLSDRVEVEIIHEDNLEKHKIGDKRKSVSAEHETSRSIKEKTQEDIIFKHDSLSEREENFKKDQEVLRAIKEETHKDIIKKDEALKNFNEKDTFKEV